MNAIQLTNKALLLMSKADWTSACSILTQLVGRSPENTVAVCNLGICMLYTGKLQEAIALMESLVFPTTSNENQHPSSLLTIAEPILFNLTTLYELSSDTNIERKKRIVSGVSFAGGQSFASECLKL